ncbi:glycoside hydrolase family 13 protein [Luedemannella helvata]|uniref:Glycoside hydrolase family 13 protein n=1 Tax=Luedemannella helvata TaxID=349315 RepID=A0ABP4VQQ2_9ACTN
MPTASETDLARDWARDAVIYEVYVRSFADHDGDGVGDLPGLTARLDYLAALGVDAVWLTPFYPSPWADGGYDVADYRAVDPQLGTLDDFDALVAAAHERGLRVIIDIVPNHTSAQHPWFQAALAGDREMRDRYVFRSGRGEEPPNNWQSIFRGPAWTRLPDGEWYLHLFASQQPDLNWEHPAVRAEFESILRFWLDRGVDGIRIDVAHGMIKAAGLPDAVDAGTELLEGDAQPYFDQDGVHEIYRAWRSILDTYAPRRIAVAEAWVPNQARTARYVRPDELHQAFNFEFLSTPWSAADYRRVIDGSLATMAAVGAPTTWVLSNHDVVRHASRLAAGIGGAAGGATGAGDPAATADPAVGLRRARAAILVMLALPGSVYLYQGEELGLPEVFDLPAGARQDPIFARTNGAELGRDGCRVPLPWSGDAAPYGFGPAGSRPWLPQPATWARLSVEAQARDAGSTLSLYRAALAERRRLAGLGDGVLRWLPSPAPDTLVFARDAAESTVVCVANLGATAVPLPAELPAPLLTSGPCPNSGELPADTTAWFVLTGGAGPDGWTIT